FRAGECCKTFLSGLQRPVLFAPDTNMNNRRQRRLDRNCPTLAQALDRYLEEVSSKKKSGYQEQSIARAWRATLLINRNLARITANDLRRLRDEWLKDRKPA